MDVRVGYKESWVLKNWCFWTVVLEKTLESPLDCMEIQPVHPEGNHWKDWCWSWNSNILATWCEELTHLKRPWCWERLEAGGEGDDRGWDGWMALPTQWTWVLVNSGGWWWTGRPGLLQSMGSQRVGHDWTDWLMERRNRIFRVYQFNSVIQSFMTLCVFMDCSTPGFLVHHQLLELAQTHVYQVSDAIQPSHYNSDCHKNTLRISLGIIDKFLGLTRRDSDYEVLIRT